MANSKDVPIYEDVKTWQNEHVIDWLHKIGFVEFVAGFESKNIDGKRMLDLSPDELRRCYPNIMRSSKREDPHVVLMRRIKEVKDNRKKGFIGNISSRFAGHNSKRNPVPVPKSPDYPPNGHSQSQDGEAWPDDEFDDDEEYDTPAQSEHTGHLRTSSYHGSTGTTASSTTGESDQLYTDPGAEEDDFGGTYEVPGQTPNSMVQGEDYDATYDEVPQDMLDDIQGRTPGSQSGHWPHMQVPSTQPTRRSPSPSRRPGYNDSAVPPRPAKRSPAQRNLPTVPSARPPQRHPPHPGDSARMPPKFGHPNGGNHEDDDDSDDAEDYLTPDNLESGDLYEVADNRNDQQLAPPPHEVPKRNSHHSLPPPPDEDEQPELYVVPNEHLSSPNLEEDDLYLAPDERRESPNKPVPRRELPTPPGGRPKLPTPQLTPQRPPKPNSMNNTNSNNIKPPAIPTRTPVVHRPSRTTPSTVVLPNPAIHLPPSRSPAEEEVQPVVNEIQHASQSELGERTGSIVSGLRQRFSTPSSSSSSSSTASERYIKSPIRPTIPPKNVQMSETPVPTLPKPRPPIPTSNTTATVPTPSLPVNKPRQRPFGGGPQKPVMPPPIPTPGRPEPQIPEPVKPVKPQPSPRPPHPTEPELVVPPQEPKPSTPTPPRRPPPSPTPRSTTVTPQKHNELDGFPWYHGNLKREHAFQAVTDCRQDGAFLVRDSERGGADAPYSLTLWYNNQVRNLKIRQRKEDGKFALGNKKPNEVTHDNASAMIQYYQQEPVILANNAGKVILKVAVPIFN